MIKYLFIRIDGDRLPARIIVNETVSLLGWNNKPYNVDFDMRQPFKLRKYQCTNCTRKEAFAWEPDEASPCKHEPCDSECVHIDECQAKEASRPRIQPTRSGASGENPRKREMYTAKYVMITISEYPVPCLVDPDSIGDNGSFNCTCIFDGPDTGVIGADLTEGTKCTQKEAFAWKPPKPKSARETVRENPYKAVMSHLVSGLGCGSCDARSGCTDPTYGDFRCFTRLYNHANAHETSHES